MPFLTIITTTLDGERSGDMLLFCLIVVVLIRLREFARSVIRE